MHAVTQYWKTLSASLRIRNYRLYFIGQAVSISGTWMQTIALGWLILTLTGSGSQLGLVLALQFLPLLLVTPLGGLLADAFDKRKLLFITQAVLAVLPLALGLLIIADRIEMWMVYCFALALGLANAIDHPARQTFVHELVGSGNLRNAIALNSTLANLARAIGPSIGGVLIATLGIGFCFLFNALSYLPLIAALVYIRGKELHRSVRQPRAKGQLKEGWRYATSHPVIRSILLMAAVTGTFAYEFQVTLPLLAQGVFGSGVGDYAALWVAMGVGSVIGGLFAAGRSEIAPRHLIFFTLFFGVSLIATALTPSLALAIVGMGFVGFFSINVLSLANTMLQLESAPHMRGRVMSLWAMAMLGSPPVGGPIIGFVGEHFGGRWSLGIGGIAALASIVFILFLLRRDTLRQVPATVQVGLRKTELAEELQLRD